MRGDFSAWNKDRTHNFRGTLHQQGRVLLDRDWNAQTEIMGEWQETAARDAFGAGIAAVPAAEPLGFKVTQAQIVGGIVKVSLNKGRAWADGLLAELMRDAEPPALPAGVDAIRTATYFGPPIQGVPTPGDVPSTGAGIRDAVILETWLEELSPFQRPELLLEAALGGVDTTERVQTAFRLRLYRMADGDTCASIVPKLKDDFAAKGKLAVELKPTAEVDADCPVVETGGFTGFEHRLYRIEIAATDKPSPQAYFKWSHFNGGLVGTGDFNAATRDVTIHGNRNAILYSGLSSVYLEALDYDAALGGWTVVYGAKASLGSNGVITLPANPADTFKGSIPPAPATGRRFFRLWNGIERISTFSTAKKDLPDNLGILLQFEAEGTGKYTPSDFWTFEVRAGGIGNPTVPIPNLPPQGIFYHRVPLAEVYWTGATVTGGDIEDCRQTFQPLTKLKGCCTYRVGDGIHSYGDFTNVQDAINALPPAGGEICLLPGLYQENIVIAPPHNTNIIIKGCGRRTRIEAVTAQPAISVESGQGVRIESLAVEAHADGIGILLTGVERDALNAGAAEYLKDIVLSGLCVTAVQHNAIQGHIAQGLTLINSIIHIKEADATRRVAVYLTGDDMLIERNEIRVLPDRAVAANLGHEYTNDPALFTPAQEAFGGLQIGGGSERVRILNNLIVNGTGNGITLGSIDVESADGTGFVSTYGPFNPKGATLDCCEPDDGFIDEGEKDDEGRTPVAAPPLYDILIDGNRIFNMGRNGIGVATFFSLGTDGTIPNMKALSNVTGAGIVSVARLVISDNRIELCMNIAPANGIPPKMSQLMGFGGIALADTEDLIVRDNYLAKNGPDFLQPICGIYVLSGQGIEISRNHILENGLGRTAEVTATTLRNGARGGIFIARTRSPGVEAFTSSAGTAFFASGYPAAKIQENIVTVPMGRSLTILATGAVSVVGNQFTSFNVPPLSVSELIAAVTDEQSGITAGAKLELMSLLAGNVLIFNQGAGAFMPGNTGFTSIQNGAAASSPGSTLNPLHRFFGNGTVLFANNQCHQNLFTPGFGLAISSVCILALDDVGFNANQCDCDFDSDFFLVNALVFAPTVRVSDNRFRESLTKVFFSAATFGLQNITTDNESVHCLLVRGKAYVKRHNLVLLELTTVNGDVMLKPQNEETLCDKLTGWFPQMGGD